VTAVTESTDLMTSRQIAAALGIGTRTRNYVMRDREGYTILGACGLPRYQLVLSALSRSDVSDVTTRVHTVAYALLKCVSTGRMHPVSSLRIQAYTPYRLCMLVARIAAECPETTIGGICDVWLLDNHTDL
jgi:hypothetical protein